MQNSDDIEAGTKPNTKGVYRLKFDTAFCAGHLCIPCRNYDQAIAKEHSAFAPFIQGRQRTKAAAGDS